MADNVVTSRMGVGVVGRHVEIADNFIHLVNGLGTRFGIVAVNSVGVVCENNQIELRTSGDPDEFFFALANESASTAGTLGLYVAAGANVISAGILVIGGSAAQVKANTVHSEGSVTLRGLYAENHNLLAVKGNEFLSGPVSCVSTNEVIILDNTVSGVVEITRAESGMLCDNRIRWREERFDGSLTVLDARSNWKAADNRVDGTLRIRPAVRIPAQFNTYDVFTKAETAFSPRSFASLAAIDELAGDEHFSSIVFPSRPAGAIESSRVEAIKAARSGPEKAAYAIGNPTWAVDYGAAMMDFVSKGAAGGFGGFAKDVAVAMMPFFREEAYHVMCTSNWARDVEIGHAGGNVRPNVQSIVQVISNRADEEISVQFYSHLVIALNVAHQYPLAGTGAPASILQPNLAI